MVLKEKGASRIHFGFFVGVARLSSIRMSYHASNLPALKQSKTFDLNEGTLVLSTEEENITISFNASPRSLDYGEFLDLLICEIVPRVKDFAEVSPRPSELISINDIEECSISITPSSLKTALSRVLKILPFYMKALGLSSRK